MRDLWVIVLSVSLAGCAPRPQADYLPQTGDSALTRPENVEYSFGVLPLQNAVQLYETYEPVIEEINSHVSGFTVRLETAKDYPHYEAKVRARRLSFLMMNAHLVIPAEERGYQIVGRSADTIRGVILVRRDSSVRRIRDLSGVPISFASSTDLPGAMMPKLLMKQNGLDVDREAAPKYVGSPDSAIMSVYFKWSAAGCVSESAWRSFETRRPDLADALMVRWESAPLIGMGILARSDVPRERVQEVSRALFELNASERGRKILSRVGITGFVPANEATYDRVWEFLNDYNRAFGFSPSLRGSD